MIWVYVHGLVSFLEEKQSCIFRFPEERDKSVFIKHNMTVMLLLHNDIVMEDRIPVTQMTLECKQIFIEALDGFLLQDIVDAIPSIQHAHFYLCLLFLLGLRTLNRLLCKQTVRFRFWLSLSWSVHSKLEKWWKGKRILTVVNLPSPCCFSSSALIWLATMASCSCSWADEVWARANSLRVCQALFKELMKPCFMSEPILDKLSFNSGHKSQQINYY